MNVCVGKNAWKSHKMCETWKVCVTQQLGKIYLQFHKTYGCYTWQSGNAMNEVQNANVTLKRHRFVPVFDYELVKQQYFILLNDTVPKNRQQFVTINRFSGCRHYGLEKVLRVVALFMDCQLWRVNSLQLTCWLLKVSWNCLFKHWEWRMC